MVLLFLVNKPLHIINGCSFKRYEAVEKVKHHGARHHSQLDELFSTIIHSAFLTKDKATGAIFQQWP